jgi:hypothetical protein
MKKKKTGTIGEKSKAKPGHRKGFSDAEEKDLCGGLKDLSRIRFGNTV